MCRFSYWFDKLRLMNKAVPCYWLKQHFLIQSGFYMVAIKDTHEPLFLQATAAEILTFNAGVVNSGRWVTT